MERKLTYTNHSDEEIVLDQMIHRPIDKIKSENVLI